MPDTPPVAKRGRGRPPVGIRVSVRLPADVLAEVDALAELAEVPRAEFLRDLIATAVKR